MVINQVYGMNIQEGWSIFEDQTWEYPSSKIMELFDLNEEHGAMDEDASMMFEEHIVPATTDGK